MLGRMMSMMMLSNTGLVPISQAISGAVSKWSLTALFAGAGVLILLLTLITALQPELKHSATAWWQSLSPKQKHLPKDIRRNQKKVASWRNAPFATFLILKVNLYSGLHDVLVTLPVRAGQSHLFFVFCFVCLRVLRGEKSFFH